jgi:hypothetical protein
MNKNTEKPHNKHPTHATKNVRSALRKDIVLFNNQINQAGHRLSSKLIQRISLSGKTRKMCRFVGKTLTASVHRNPDYATRFGGILGTAGLKK